MKVLSHLGQNEMNQKIEQRKNMIKEKRRRETI